MNSPCRFGLVFLVILLTPLAVLVGCGSGGVPITPDPTISPAGGNYTGTQVISIADIDPNAEIYVTTDGSVPGTITTATNFLYDAPIPISRSPTTVKAIAVTKGYEASAVVSATYNLVLPVAPVPTFSPPPGIYGPGLKVKISDSLPNAYIYDTTDGTTPTPTMPIYIVPLTLNATTTVKAIADPPGYAPSAVVSATYTILPVAAAPTISPPGGSYASAQTVVLADATPNATIYYTTDGKLPSTSSPVYAGPFTIAASAMVSAIATAPGYSESPISSEIYNIGGKPYTKNMWTWMGGSNLSGQSPVYGTQGVASTSNTPGGNTGGVAFPGENGSFYYLGGQSTDPAGVSQALWRYDPLSGAWTWVAGSDTVAPPVYGSLGVGSPANLPPERSYAAGWQDSGGNLFWFGGYGYASKKGNVDLNDLWEFNPGTNALTWLDGSNKQGSLGFAGTMQVAAATNVPSARENAAHCTDSRGKFWLFGGDSPELSHYPLPDYYFFEDYFNDLWQFDPATKEWTWYTGSTQRDDPGVYGVVGTASVNYSPARATGMSCWGDADGNLWLFGGGIAAGEIIIYSTQKGPAELDFYFPYDYNQLWKFNTATLEWTWVSGETHPNQFGEYGTRQHPSADNLPGSRDSFSTWSGPEGYLWLFGGNVLSGNSTLANDFWRYNVATGEWTWMTGDAKVPTSSPFQPNGYLVYGTMGVTDSANTPGARLNAATWVDRDGNLWMFGGYGIDANGNYGYLSDVWRYEPVY